MYYMLCNTHFYTTHSTIYTISNLQTTFITNYTELALETTYNVLHIKTTWITKYTVHTLKTLQAVCNILNIKPTCITKYMWLCRLSNKYYKLYIELETLQTKHIANQRYYKLHSTFYTTCCANYIYTTCITIYTVHTLHALQTKHITNYTCFKCYTHCKLHNYILQNVHFTNYTHCQAHNTCFAI